MSKLQITTPTGKIINLDFKHMIGDIPDINLTGKLKLGPWPTPKESLPQEYIDAGVTHRFMINNKSICITTDIADVLRTAYKDYVWKDIQTKDKILAKAIPGLSLLKAAIEAENTYQEQFSAMMEDEYNDGANPPSLPDSSSEDLAKQYPLAALYVKAECYSYASHSSKAVAGQEAMIVLVDTGDTAKANDLLDNWLPANAYLD